MEKCIHDFPIGSEEAAEATCSKCGITRAEASRQLRETTPLRQEPSEEPLLRDFKERVGFETESE